MSETYQSRQRKKQHQPQGILLSKTWQLLVKQTAASLICLALVFGMHHASSPYLRRCADALGTALRFESDLSVLSQIKEYISPDRSSTPLPESDEPLTEH